MVEHNYSSSSSTQKGFSFTLHRHSPPLPSRPLPTLPQNVDDDHNNNVGNFVW